MEFLLQPNQNSLTFYTNLRYDECMKIIYSLFAALILSVFTSGCMQFDTVEPGQVGVLVNFGKLDSHVYRPGFYWYSIMANDMEFMTTRMQTYTFGGRVEQQRNQQQDVEVAENENSHIGPELEVRTNDSMQIKVDITVQYHLNGAYAPSVFREFGLTYNEALVEVPVRSAVRMAASEFIAQDLMTHREQLQAMMEQKIAEQVSLTLHSKGVDRHAIIVDNVSLRQIDLPASLDNSIRMVQEQQMQTLQRTQAIETARQEATQARIQAEGAAQAQLIRANGTAEANRAVSASLTPQILRLREFEAQYAMVANPNARIVVVPYGQPTLVNLPPMQQAAVAAASPPAR